MPFTTALGLRLQTLTNSELDSQFYKSVHAYIDLIMDNEIGRQIIRKSEQAYSKENVAIHNIPGIENDYDEINRQRRRVETFNLYANNFVTPYVRIYLPIEDYIKSKKLHKDSDPAALIALYGRKSSVVKHWCKNRPTIPYRESIKEVKALDKWFTGMRQEYEKMLQQFHVDFLTAYQKYEKDNLGLISEEQPKRLTLNYITGDFFVDGKSGTVKPATQEFKILGVLLTSENYQAEYLECIQSYRPRISNASKSEKADLYKIMQRLRDNLGVEDLIENVKGVGYRINNTPKNND